MIAYYLFHCTILLHKNTTVFFKFSAILKRLFHKSGIAATYCGGSMIQRGSVFSNRYNNRQNKNPRPPISYEMGGRGHIRHLYIIIAQYQNTNGAYCSQSAAFFRTPIAGMALGKWFCYSTHRCCFGRQIRFVRDFLRQCTICVRR